MRLGDTIYRLRTERGMSQGELAEALGVSRQSVSKWETDASVPELDKLLRLSDLFGVTLDSLARGGDAASATDPPGSGEAPQDEGAPTAPPPPASGLPGRKTAGIILFCMGFLVILCLSILSSPAAGLIFASPFVLCGCVCMTVRRNTGLWCFWAAFFAVDLYLRYATGISWWIVRLTPVFTEQMNYFRLAVGWGQFICALTLTTVTVLRFGKAPLTPDRRGAALLVCGFALFVVLCVVPISLPFESAPLVRICRCALDWIRLALFCAVASLGLRLLRARRAGKK